ncbi:MAG: hypothetical protein JSV50_19080 [Desulfobacteraceae bacterium]|nr:MAG: hypothetical protein JSV50_19080 [Desulfobacteraceae bacterium]
MEKKQRRSTYPKKKKSYACPELREWGTIVDLTRIKGKTAYSDIFGTGSKTPPGQTNMN